MNHVWIREGYRSCLGLYDTQKAIGLIKNLFQQKLCLALHLKRVTAPLFVEPSSGLNDDLNGVERPVGFDIPAVGGEGAQVVHSLAKWKRMALYRYDFHPGNGLLTDMNAIRRDEELDNLHSIYVDQWDWEKVILPEERTLDYLKDTVRKIVGVICNTLEELQYYFPQLPGGLSRDITFVTTQELEDRWPHLTPKEREDALPTTTTGRSTATCSSGTTFSTARSSSRAWVSAWIRRPWTASSPRRAATRAAP